MQGPEQRDEQAANEQFGGGVARGAEELQANREGGRRGGAGEDGGVEGCGWRGGEQGA